MTTTMETPTEKTKGLHVSGKKGWAILIAIIVVAIILGSALAASGAPETKTVTKLVTQTRTVTSIVNHTQTVSETPQACADALDTAETLLSKAGDGITVMSDTIGTISDVLGSFDVDAINAATSKIQANTAKIQAMSDEVGRLRSSFDSQAEECRAS